MMVYLIYVCELNPNHKVYLENSGNQTLITTMSGGIGQQQQSSSGFHTGNWTLPPQVYLIAQGIAIKITSAVREHWIQIQGSNLSMLSSTPSLENAQPIPLQKATQPPISSIPPMQPMQPMQSMQPMKMGDMQMSMNPMEMRMGNMEMRLGNPQSPQKQFCSQCGNKIQSGDRFCSSCGYSLE